MRQIVNLQYRKVQVWFGFHAANTIEKPAKQLRGRIRLYQDDV